MPKPKRGPRLGAGPKHQKLLLANQASDLFRHGRIRTTETKAKTLRPYAEKLITKAKRGDLHARRQLLSDLRDRDVVAYLVEEVAPRFEGRNGGYTRILKLGPRAGDAAPMALIELVEQGASSGDDQIEEAKAGRRGLFGRRRRGRREDPAPLDDIGLDLDEDQPDDADLPEVKDADQIPESDVAPQAPAEDPQEPDPDRDIRPDAGGATGG